MKRLLLVLLIAAAATACRADEESGGLFSEGSFLSETISSVTGKINKVASGEEKILDENARGMDQDEAGYYRDPLFDRPASGAVRGDIRKNER